MAHLAPVNDNSRLLCLSHYQQWYTQTESGDCEHPEGLHKLQRGWGKVESYRPLLTRLNSATLCLADDFGT